jgi:hypothetical protein
LLLERLGDRADFPRAAIDLRMAHAGQVAHYPPEAADAIIRDALKVWLPGTDFSDRAITGRVAVLGGEAWIRTLRAYLAGTAPNITDTMAVANAFNDPEGNVFIGADRGNAGTMIHEGIHAYAPDDFLRKYGTDLNEGVTEYFARKITRGLGIERRQYDDEYLAAYFTGDLSGLKGTRIPEILPFSQVVRTARRNFLNG